MKIIEENLIDKQNELIQTNDNNINKNYKLNSALNNINITLDQIQNTINSNYILKNNDLKFKTENQLTTIYKPNFLKINKKIQKIDQIQFNLQNLMLQWKLNDNESKVKFCL